MDQLLAMRMFVRIVDAGSFGKAADGMRVPRPTATKLVQDLEAHLGAMLLQRTTRRINVTAEGAAYYERAARILDEIADVDAAVASARALPKGRIRVDIGSSLANLILIPALPGFRRRYPDLELDLGVSDRPIDLVENGVDCAIRGGALADTSMIAKKLVELDYVTCATRTYLAAHGTPASPKALEHHTIVHYFSAATSKPFPLVFQRGAKDHRILGHSAVAVNESTAHLSALLAGLGIGQTFGFMARPQATLVPILTAWTRPRHPIHALYPANRHLNAKVRVFVDWLAEIFAG